MTDVEKKLAEYRARKALEEKPKTSRKLFSFFSKTKECDKDKELKKKLLDENDVDEPDSKTLISSDNDLESDVDVDDSLNCCTYTDLFYYGLCLALWATLWYIFIKLQFGTVYFLTSGLVGIYLNTRTRPKVKGEVSAYSVFNKDCKSIDGTLKAEQFEREIRYGSAAVH
ncbi:SAYSVFN motif domain containing 1 [Leptinotarsa decemlineata]|uniref:SAYSVFN motif domain containing 1 n=1 Tax=Leptinotarsa decemlineata TaxID=7539 RepID=UPI003D30BCE4